MRQVEAVSRKCRVAAAAIMPRYYDSNFNEGLDRE
jgi:hypothetical protein